MAETRFANEQELTDLKALEQNQNSVDNNSTNPSSDLNKENLIPKSDWMDKAINDSNPENSTNPPSLDPLNKPSKGTEVLTSLKADQTARNEKKEQNPTDSIPPFVRQMIDNRAKTDGSSQSTEKTETSPRLSNNGHFPQESSNLEATNVVIEENNSTQANSTQKPKEESKPLLSSIDIVKNGANFPEKTAFSKGVLLEEQKPTEEQTSPSQEELLEQVKNNLAQIDNTPKPKPQLKSALDIANLDTANNGSFPQKRASQEFPNGVLVGSETQEKSVDSKTKLVQSAAVLGNTLGELKDSNDSQLQLTIKNLIIGVGNIVNAEGQSSITMGDSSVTNEINLGVGEQPVLEKASDGDSKGTNKVEELEKLHKEKEELEKKQADPNLSKDEKDKIEKAKDELDDVIENTEDVIEEEQEKAASAVVKLTEEDKKELSDAGKTKEGFMAAITRMFKGKKWSAFLANAGLSTASTLAVSKAAAVTIATFGPVGIGVVGGVLVGLGGIAAFKTIKNVKETADSQGVSWKELLKEKKFVLGALLGSAVSGSTRIGLPTLIPGVGPILPLLGMAAELGVSGIGERNLNKKQAELVEKYLSSFELRRYQRLQEQGYLRRDGVNIEKIVADMTDPNVTADGSKTAKKAAIASLLYLYNKTNDEKYKTLHYTVKENNVDVRKELDITTLSVQDTEDNTDEYPKLELTGNFESYVDTLDLEELKTLTLQAASGFSSLEDKKELTNELVGLFVGIEATDVDNLLTQEREQYFESVAFLTGFRTGSGVMNSLIIIGSGATLVEQAVEAHNQVSSDSSVEQEYRESLADEDANVDSYTREDGTKVNTIDLDGDGTPDLIHDTGSNEYSASTVSGAEKLFEIQNPEIGDVNTSQFETSTTGITGTFVAEGGEVVGVMYNDVNGNIGIMNSAQLGQTLGATYANGSSASFNISTIQPNGETILNIGDQQYSTNLSTLEGIGGTDAVLGIDPLTGTVNPGDSVPSVLTKIMQQVKADNPNLSQYDDYELQRSLYQGDRLANDSAIRSEFGFTNPVQPGQEFNVRNSPTILGWLEGLNGGPVTLPETGSSISGSDGISFTFSGPQVNTISLDGLTPFEVDVPVDTEINTTHLATLVTAGIGAFAPRQVGGITRSTTIELFGGDAETPDPTPIVIPGPTPTPEQEKEFIFNVLKTQVFTYVRSKKGKTKVVAGEMFHLGEKELKATETGWLLDNEHIENNDLSTIVEAFLSTGDRNEQSKVLVEILDKIMPTKRVELGNAIEFHKLNNGTWREYTKIRDQKTKGEDINSSELADRILLIQRDEAGKITGNRALPGGQEVKTESTNTDTTVKTTSTTETTTQSTAQAEKETTVETTSAEGENKIEKPQKEQFEVVMREIIKTLNNKIQLITINNSDYLYDPETELWKLEGRNEEAKAQLTENEVYSFLNTAHASKDKNTRETLAKDIQTMLSRLTEDGTVHDKPKDRIRIGTTTYVRVRGGTDAPIWRADDKKNPENSGTFNDQELAGKIINIERSEQQDKTPEVKEAEKPEKKGRKLLRLALLATGIGGGVLASSLTGMPAAVALSAAVVGSGSWVVKSIEQARERSLRRQSDEMKKDIRERINSRFTDQEIEKDRQFEKKMKRARNIVEICKDISWLTTPMAITSLAYGFLSPNISDIGMQVDIKTWLEGTVNKIRMTPEIVSESIKFGK
jgi:hypothetical protein